MKPIITVAFIALLSSHCFAQNLIKASPERMEERIKALSQFGANPEGGVSRVAYSDADIAGRQYVMGLMKNAGLTGSEY